MARPDFDPTAFTTRYGYSPQEYVERVAVSTLRAPQLAKAEALLAEGKAELAGAKTNDARAHAEDKIQAAAEQIHAAEYNRDIAIKFRDGLVEFGTLTSQLGRFVNEIVSAMDIDSDAVRAALVAASE